MIYIQVGKNSVENLPGSKKPVNIKFFCHISRIDAVNMCKKTFLGYFHEFESYVFVHVAQDDR